MCVRARDTQLLGVPETVADTIATELERYRAVVAVTAIPSALAVVLSIVGIYGVTAFDAAQRPQEVGVRMALGAQPPEIVRLFLRSLRGPLLAGFVLGLPLAGFAAVLLQRARMLVNVPAIDPLTYGAAALVLVAAATLATWIPARRAVRTDPWRALRME